MERARASLWWLPPLAACAAIAALDAGGRPVDIPLFAAAADTLFSGRWLDTFAAPDLQSGPLQIALLGALARLAGALGVSSTAVFSFAVELGVLAALLAAVACLLRRRPRVRGPAVLLTGLVAVGTGLPHWSFVDGHPAQVWIPLAWALAAREARRGRALRAGLLVGLSAGLETWGVLGAAVLALAGRRRAVLAGLGVEAAVVAALFAPFALGGDFGMLRYRWEVAGGAPLGLVVPAGTAFGWSLRLLQGAVAVGAGALVAARARRLREAAWLVPLAVVATRLLLEPVWNPWYFLALETLGLLGAAGLAGGDLLDRVRAGRPGRLDPLGAGPGPGCPLP